MTFAIPARMTDLSSLSPRVRTSVLNMRRLVPLLALWNLAVLFHGPLICRIFAVAFLLVIPGVVVLAPTPLQPLETSVRFAWSMGMSILVLMLLGLGYSELLPHVGLDRPLSELPLVIGLDVLLLVAGAIQSRRRDPLGYLFRSDSLFPFRDLTPTELALGLVLLCMPILSAFGAERLNNGDNGDLAILALLLVGGVLAVTFVFAERLPGWFIPASLYLSTAAILLSESMRTVYPYGFDIQTEFQVATTTLHNGVWNVPAGGNPYSAMLSITVFPTILSSLTHVSIAYLMKAAYPFVFCSFPVLCYVIAGRWYARRPALIGAVVVIVQGVYAADISALTRQEVGLLYFGLFCVTAFDRNLSRRVRQFAVVICVAAMSIAHYSTAYFTVTTLGIGYVTYFVFRVVRRHRRVRAIFSLPVMVLMLGSVFFWNVAITHSAQNIGSFVTSLDSDGLQLLAGSPGQSLVTRILVSDVQTPPNTPSSFSTGAAVFIKHDLTYIHPYPKSVTSKYPLKSGNVAPASPTHLPAITKTVVSLGQAVMNELLLLMLAIGVVALLWNERFFKRPERAEFASFAIGCSVLLAVLRFSGTVSQLYNSPRGQVQSAPMLGVATAFVATWLFQRRRTGKIYTGLLAAALSLLLFSDSSLANFALTGSGVDTFSNSGEAYQDDDITAADSVSADWVVMHHAPPGVITYTDLYGELQLYEYEHFSGIVTAIAPDVIEPRSWIYATSTNVVDNTVRSDIGDGSTLSQLPTTFLDDETDLVFSTGTTRVYY